MKRKKRILGVLMIVAALIIMQLPVSEAEAASSSASDFKMDGSTLVRYRGSETNVTIPDTVEIIGRNAFEENKNIELVVVPNSVKRIDPYAFWGCEKLDTVVLGKGLSDVGDFAFAGCTGLKQISIPSNVTSIGIESFADCVNLTDITIPPETVNIHETAFDGCYRLVIHCETGSVADKYATVFYERQKKMPEYEDVPDYVEPNEPETPVPTAEPAATAAPEEGEMLGSTHVVGNNAVVFVQKEDFTVLDGAEQVQQQPQEEQPIGNLMGDWQENISKYTIVDGKIVADQAYYRSSGLASVALPAGIEEIGQFSFARSTLTDIILPDGVKSIDYGAFYHCDYLQSVTIPDTVMCVEPKAFACTPWVNDFLSGVDGTEGDFLIEGGVLAAYRGNAENVVIPEGVRVIAAEVFQGHTEIKSVAMPDTLLVVGEGAFENCSNLRLINLGNSVEEIKDRAFYKVSSLLSGVSLPASVNKLGLRAFGDINIVYQGMEPEHTYEVSASRLSNEAYRVYNAMNGLQTGVRVFGLEGAAASLAGADKSYDLVIETVEDSSEMENACMRSFKTALPPDMVIYNMTLSDASGIPLTKLGSQTLTVVIPVPDTLAGQNIKLLILDRNGQPEMLAADRVNMEGVESLRFQTNHLSMVGIYGAGPAGSEELLDVSVDITRFSAAPGSSRPEINSAYLTAAKFLVGGSLLITGLILTLISGRRRKIPS